MGRNADVQPQDDASEAGIRSLTTLTADGKVEEEIDWLVYDLYGLTNEETAVVRISFGKER